LRKGPAKQGQIQSFHIGKRTCKKGKINLSTSRKGLAKQGHIKHFHIENRICKTRSYTTFPHRKQDLKNKVMDQQNVIYNLSM
jgi:hypothetical protein